MKMQSEIGKLKNLDWERIKFYTRAGAYKDLDKFLDMLPVRTGHTALFLAGLSWLIAGATIVYTMSQINQANQTRKDILNIEAAQPLVPTIEKTPVPQDVLKEFVERAQPNYRNIKMDVAKNGLITITAPTTQSFSEFQTAINHVQFGGQAWETRVDKLCVGRECEGVKLRIDLKVSKVSIEAKGV